MAILTMLFRKMGKNGWLVGGLLAGMCLCTALTSSMPIYKEASLQRMMTKELERYYETSSTYPGSILASASPNFRPEQIGQQAGYVQLFDKEWESVALSEPSLPPVSSVRERQTVSFRFQPVDPARVDEEQRLTARLAARTGLREHVRLVDGRFPNAEPVNGVYEALVTDGTLAKFKMVIGVEVEITEEDWPAPLRIVPVGVAAELDVNDPYWDFASLRTFDSSFLVDEALFQAEIEQAGKAPIALLRWEATFDYPSMSLEAASKFFAMKERYQTFLQTYLPYQSSVRLPAEQIVSQYGEKEATLRSLLWSLNVPLYILVAFYLYMVSNLLIQRQRPEIAVLRSRGASRWQIIALFALESAILSAVAFATGPALGAGITSVLGASDSFMSFVDRKALPVQISAESYAFAGAAAAFSFLVYLIPVFLATRASIVDQKRAAAREDRASFWHLFGLDAVLLALSAYGWYVFERRTADMLAQGLDGRSLSVDPLLFAVPSMFILGLGLALLRLHPWLIRLVYWIGKKRWSASQFTSLLQVGRRSRQYHTLMMFLILTVGTGLYSASAARTINGNMEDQIWYASGADVVVRQNWVDDAPPQEMPGMPPVPPPERINYLEPDFSVFSDLPGVEHAARVFTKDGAVARVKGETKRMQLIGVQTDEFGRAAWMKDGLLPYHFYDYLNLIAPDPRSVLVSRSLAETFELEPGDVLEIGWGDTTFIQTTIYGVIDYFPTFQPNPDGPIGREGARPMLVVGHLETIQNELALEPYDVWLRLRSPEDRESLYAAMQERKIQIVSLTDTQERIVESRNDPFRMAMNGVMSLGFLLSLSITFIGFLLYWVLAWKGRTLQLGIFRAMGLSFRNVVGMMGTEQLLTSGAGFAIGLCCGAAASRLFVPLFQVSFDPGRIVPPFEVMIDSSDTNRLILFIGVTLILALAVLAEAMRRVKLHQALKLGED